MFTKLKALHKGYKVFSAFWDRWPKVREAGMRKFWQTMAMSVLSTIVVTVCSQFGVSEEMQKEILGWLTTALLSFIGANVAEHVTDVVKAKIGNGKPK